MDVRASDAERDATVERLRAAAGEGRLTLEELTDRIDAATGAVMRSPAVPGAPRIVLTGGTVFGTVKVRHRRLWERLLIGR